MLRKISRAFDAYSVGFAIYLVLSSTSAWGLLHIASMTSLSFSGMSGGETARSIGYIGILFAFGLGCLYFPSQCMLIAPFLLHRSTLHCYSVPWQTAT